MPEIYREVESRIEYERIPIDGIISLDDKVYSYAYLFFSACVSSFVVKALVVQHTR